MGWPNHVKLALAIFLLYEVWWQLRVLHGAGNFLEADDGDGDGDPAAVPFDQLVRRSCGIGERSLCVTVRPDLFTSMTEGANMVDPNFTQQLLESTIPRVVVDVAGSGEPLNEVYLMYPSPEHDESSPNSPVRTNDGTENGQLLHNVELAIERALQKQLGVETRRLAPSLKQRCSTLLSSDASAAAVPQNCIEEQERCCLYTSRMLSFGGGPRLARLTEKRLDLGLPVASWASQGHFLCGMQHRHCGDGMNLHKRGFRHQLLEDYEYHQKRVWSEPPGRRGQQTKKVVIFDRPNPSFVSGDSYWRMALNTSVEVMCDNGVRLEVTASPINRLFTPTAWTKAGSPVDIVVWSYTNALDRLTKNHSLPLFNVRGHWEQLLLDGDGGDRRQPFHVLFNREAPYPHAGLSRQFDLRMGTQWNSDLVAPFYGHSPATVRAHSEYSLRVAPLAGRKRRILFISSNCVAWRMNIVRELNQSVPVDVHGACQHLGDGRKSLRPVARSEIYSLLRQYTMVLAVENHVCSGYTTEKLFTPLMMGAIPVYVGSEPLSHVFSSPYAVFASDYSSVAELGAHLRALLANPAKLSEYTSWQHDPRAASAEFEDRFRVQFSKPRSAMDVWFADWRQTSAPLQVPAVASSLQQLCLVSSMTTSMPARGSDRNSLPAECQSHPGSWKFSWPLKPVPVQDSKVLSPWHPARPVNVGPTAKDAAATVIADRTNRPKAADTRHRVEQFDGHDGPASASTGQPGSRDGSSECQSVLGCLPPFVVRIKAVCLDSLVHQCRALVKSLKQAKHFVQGVTYSQLKSPPFTAGMSSDDWEEAVNGLVVERENGHDNPYVDISNHPAYISMRRNDTHEYAYGTISFQLTGVDVVESAGCRITKVRQSQSRNEARQSYLRAYSLHERATLCLSLAISNLRFKSLRDKVDTEAPAYGKCAVVGNGPSLTRMVPADLSFLSRLQRDGGMVFGSNKLYLGFSRWAFRPDVLTVVNQYVRNQTETTLRMLARGRAALTGERQTGQSPMLIVVNIRTAFTAKSREFQDEIVRSLMKLGRSVSPYLVFVDILPYKSASEPYFCPDLSECAPIPMATVTNVLFQLSYHFGCRRVVMIGVDHTFAQDNTQRHQAVRFSGADINHFDPRYFSGQVWQPADLDTSERGYVASDRFFRRNGRQIVDGTFEGKCEIFEKVDYTVELPE